MADVIEARVLCKTGTAAEWNQNPLTILDGEVAYVRNASNNRIIDEFRVGNNAESFNNLVPFKRGYSFSEIDGFFSGSTAIAGYNKPVWDKVDAGGSLANNISGTAGDSIKLRGLNVSFDSSQTTGLNEIIGRKTDGTIYRFSKAALTAFLDNAFVPAGGAINQVLAKNSASNWDLKWVDQTGGGGNSLPEWVDFTLSDMSLNGLRYDNVLLAGYNPCGFKNGIPIYVDDDYDVLPTGGIQFRPGNNIVAGDRLRFVNYQTYLSAPAPTNGIVNNDDFEFNFTPSEQMI